MKIQEINITFLLLSCSFLFAECIDALSYDYTASIECLETPHKPQYGGGIVKNPEFDHGLKGWSAFGDAKVEARVSKSGNNFVVARGRNRPNDSFSQEFFLDNDMLYTFSAWIQVSEGNVPVTAVFETINGTKYAGAVDVKSGCWSMLKGGLTVDAPGPAKLSFESNHTSVEIWVDSVSLQPFTQEQWRSHQDESLDKARKGKLRFQAVDSNGAPLANATLRIKPNRFNFPFGCATNNQILSNTAYQNWFLTRFKVTTFENEMKWYSTENTQGKIDYSVPDRMLQLMKQHNVAVRGHNILWEDPAYQPDWVKNLNPTQLNSAVQQRINSVVSHYQGQLLAWDVMNENLHFNFYETKLGNGASTQTFKTARSLDANTPLFMNEFNTIEQPGDQKSTPANYLQKLGELQGAVGGPLGIGLEGHFDVPNIPYVRATLDKLAATKLPIWLTEIDVANNPNQAGALEQILREGQSHPGVAGIVLWAAWTPQGCYKMCLTDNNFKNLPTGDVVDKLLQERGQFGLSGTTDEHGFFETSLFHGDFDVTVKHPENVNSFVTQTLSVVPRDETEESVVQVQLHA